MIYQVENTPNGYIVSAYIRDDRGYGRWRRLCNFGGRQGDARDFAYRDCPQMDDTRILLFAKVYDEAKLFQRIELGRLSPQK